MAAGNRTLVPVADHASICSIVAVNGSSSSTAHSGQTQHSIGAIVAVNGSTTTAHGGHSQHDFGDYPPGYRFCPTDSEVLVHYLMNKIMTQWLPHNKIQDVNIYQHNPYDLAAQYHALGKNEWYFFTPRGRKYPNGKRPNRAAGDGYWKVTGAGKNIKHNDTVIGIKSVLVFYKGKPKPNKNEKTNWIMDEYKTYTPPKAKGTVNYMKLDDWVLCRIRKKAKKLQKIEQNDGQVQDQPEPSRCSAEKSDPLGIKGSDLLEMNCDHYVSIADSNHGLVITPSPTNNYIQLSSSLSHQIPQLIDTDSERFITLTSNNYIQSSSSLPEIPQFTYTYNLSNVSNFSAHYHDHRPINPYYGAQPVSFGPDQIVHSTYQFVFMAHNLQEHALDSILGGFQEDYCSNPNMDNPFALQNHFMTPNYTDSLLNMDPLFHTNALNNHSMPPPL